MFVGLHSALIDIWRADFTVPHSDAEDAMQRAEQLGGDHMVIIALTVEGGRPRTPAVRRRPRRRVERPGRPPSCASAPAGGLADHLLGIPRSVPRPLRAALTDPGAPARHASTCPAPRSLRRVRAQRRRGDDRRGSLAEAEPLITALERTGRRLDRTWKIATGARCRSMMQAAVVTSRPPRHGAQAMAEHERLPMPFERARSSCCSASCNVENGETRRPDNPRCGAARVRGHGYPVVGRPVRDELARTNVDPTRDLSSPVRTAGGRTGRVRMTNRDIAARGSVSTKTVEPNLTQHLPEAAASAAAPTRPAHRRT